MNRSRAELYYVGDQLLATEEAMGPETGVAGPRDTQPARGRAVPSLVSPHGFEDGIPLLAHIGVSFSWDPGDF